MRKMALPILLASSLAVAVPASAETDFGNIVSGMAQSLISQQQDRNTYLEAQNSNSVSAYRNYLMAFPNGAYRVNAEQALAKMGASADPGDSPQYGGGNQSAASVEASIRLSRSQRIQIQKQLSSMGYPTGMADGLWGANTRNAIARWQAANKMTASGYVTARQIRLIAQQAGSYVDTDNDESDAGNDQLEERLLSLTYAERREVQRRLTSLGYNTGGTDGGFGRNTRRALAYWQRDEGLRASGYLTADQLRALRRQTGA